VTRALGERNDAALVVAVSVRMERIDAVAVGRGAGEVVSCSLTPDQFFRVVADSELAHLLVIREVDS
jgi:hypothetical protein